MKAPSYKTAKKKYPWLICHFCNGCGPGWFDVPDFMSADSCNEHDWDYLIGGPKKIRWKSDKKLLKNMLKDAKGKGFFKKSLNFVQAMIYYPAVLNGGQYFWNANGPMSFEELLARFRKETRRNGLTNEKVTKADDIQIPR
jgi:hypothetical protein